MGPHLCGEHSSQVHGDRAVGPGAGEGEESWCWMRHISVGEDEHVLGVRVAATQREWTWCPNL